MSYDRPQKKYASAAQDWLLTIPVMQQSVLFSAIRGMDGMRKLHPAKALMRFYRRSVLISAFDGRALVNPWEPGGGDFTGPSLRLQELEHDASVYVYEGLPRAGSSDPWQLMRGPVADDFLRARDEMPLHFFSHMAHAFEIVGYKHPAPEVAALFRNVYVRMCHALHMWPESEEQLDRRLGDTEAGWREREDAAGSCST